MQIMPPTYQVERPCAEAAAPLVCKRLGRLLETEILRLITKVSTVLDVLIVDKTVRRRLIFSPGFLDVVTNMVSRNEEVEDVFNIEIGGQARMLSLRSIKHVAWSSEFQECHG